MGQLELMNDGFEFVGNGRTSSIIRQTSDERVFQVDSGVDATFRSLRITGGEADGSGGGIFNEGDVTLTLPRSGTTSPWATTPRRAAVASTTPARS